MNQELRWLAENVQEWALGECGFIGVLWAEPVYGVGETMSCPFSRSEWQQARIDLGLHPTPEEDEEWERLSQKQPRYQDSKGEDWIDECARTFTPEEFRGAMRFTIGKYNRRMGKKDELIKEIEKMRDYCSRWLEVEVGR